MQGVYYVGMDIHKKTVVYCAMKADGTIVAKGRLRARRAELSSWAQGLPTPWVGAMEATLFTHWIYEFLKPYAHDLKVGHPPQLKVMLGSKHKSDPRDALGITNLLRCGLFPEVHMVSKEIYELRQALRFRNQLVRMAVRMHNKAAGLLMEHGAEYDKKRLKGKKYFTTLVDSLEEVPELVLGLLRMSRSNYEMFQMMQNRIVRALCSHEALKRRVERLRSIRGVGEITALTWALEVGDPHRFSSIPRATSYCGLCSAQNETAGKNRPSRLGKQCNQHLQSVLIEAAKLAPSHNVQLREVYERELSRTGCENTATLAVARKLVAWLLAIDKKEEDFQVRQAA
jgi:transposase